MSGICRFPKILSTFGFLALIVLQDTTSTVAVSLRGRGRAIRSILDPNQLRQSEYRLTTCKKQNIICGFLQANAKGVSRLDLCSCPSGFSGCPMTWDSEDGHSITMGSDQYKFCGEAPKLSPCDPDQLAYTGRLIHSTKNTDLVSYQDEMHCYCPESHNYVLLKQEWGPHAENETVVFSYTCTPLPTCRVGDSCKVVTENDTEFLVDRKCQCAHGFSCPTVGNRGVKVHHTELGRVETLKCQI